MNIVDFPTELHEHMALYMGLDAIAFYMTCKQIALIDTEPFWRQLYLSDAASYSPTCGCVCNEHPPDMVARNINSTTCTYKQVCVYLRKIQLAVRTDPDTEHVIAATIQWPGASIRFIMNDMYTAHRHRFCMQGKKWELPTGVKSYGDLMDIFATRKMYWSLAELLARNPSRSVIQYVRRGRSNIAHTSGVSKADMISIVKRHADGVDLADSVAVASAFKHCVTEFDDIIDGLRRNHDVTTADFMHYMALYRKRRADIMRLGYDVFNYCVHPTREQQYIQLTRSIADKLHASIYRCIGSVLPRAWAMFYGDELRVMLGAVGVHMYGHTQDAKFTPVIDTMLGHAHMLLTNLQADLANLDADKAQAPAVKRIVRLVQIALIMVGGGSREEKIRALHIQL